MCLVCYVVESRGFGSSENFGTASDGVLYLEMFIFVLGVDLSRCLIRVGWERMMERCWFMGNKR